MKKKLSIETLAVHGTYKKDETGATNPAIYLSNAYQFKDCTHGANLFDLSEAGYIYSRLNNPTTNVLEETVTALEGGIAALACASGQFAEFMTIATLAKCGDNIVTSNLLYGGTHTLFASQLARFGIEIRFADPKNIDEFDKLIDDKTKAIYIESIANPQGFVPNFKKFAELSEKHKVPLVVDNTCATPYLVRPIKYGAHIVIHSATKFLGGHGAVLGGIVVDSGKFDWEASGRFPELTTPDESYHGLVFTKHFGAAALAAKMRVSAMRDIGGTISPFNAFMIQQGIGTLHVRMERHVENAKKLAKFLENHKNVAWVDYNGLKDNKNHKNANKYLTLGGGSLFTFGVKGGFEKSKEFIEKVTIALHVSNLGDIKTIVTHPASTTHRQLSEKELEATGISTDLIRVSVGIENIDDIIKDFDKALGD